MTAKQNSPSSTKELAVFFDHTLLKPDATKIDIEKLCQQAKDYHCYAVCVNPGYVKFCSDWLSDTNVKVTGVVGFPLGSHFTETKVQETKQILGNGAHEIDMVMNLGDFKSKNFSATQKDIQAVVFAAGKAPVKVIIETCLLHPEEIIIACKMCKEAGASFVKTSTGFSTGGAKTQDVKLIRDTVGAHMGVKASGGIKTLERACAMIQAGANRLGSLMSVEILKEAKEKWGK